MPRSSGQGRRVVQQLVDSMARDGLEPAYNPLPRLSNILNMAMDTVINTVRLVRLHTAANLESVVAATTEQ